MKFSTPRDPAALAAFINLRVLNPEHEHWQRGIGAAVLYAREVGDLKVPFTPEISDGAGGAGQSEQGREAGSTRASSILAQSAWVMLAAAWGTRTVRN